MGLSAQPNARVTGPADAPAVLFLHGFGCGQEIWRHVAPAVAERHRVVLLDLPGSGAADPASYDAQRHLSLQAYADDVLQVVDELGLPEVTVVGHSVASMIAVLAGAAAPDVVTRLVLVTPSARYVDDGDYRGGFSEDDIDELLEMMDRNHLGWQDPLAAMVAGGAGEDTRADLSASFCRTRPEFARQFAEVTFRGDNRADLARVTAPTLVLHVRDDLLAPMSAVEHVHQQVPGSVLQVLEARGHVPHLSVPDLVVEAIEGFLGAGARG